MALRSGLAPGGAVLTDREDIAPRATNSEGMLQPSPPQRGLGSPEAAALKAQMVSQLRKAGVISSLKVY
jgi:hypothetical protein